jgi:hypothetical protein
MTIRERTHGKQSRVSRDPIPLFFLSILIRFVVIRTGIFIIVTIYLHNSIEGYQHCNKLSKGAVQPVDVLIFLPDQPQQTACIQVQSPIIFASQESPGLRQRH